MGREAELQVLGAWLDQVDSGATMLGLVEGEAGIGKTALVSAWARTVAGRALVVEGRCDEMSGDLPLQPVLDGLDALLRQLGPAHASEVVGDHVGRCRPRTGPLVQRPSLLPATCRRAPFSLVLIIEDTRTDGGA